MRFEKWQALGNDYVIVEAAALPAPLTAPVVRALCDRHTGVGADGVLLLQPPDEPGFVARLRIFNPDGSEAELSGNGAREAIMYLRHRGWTDRDQFSIQTVAGEIRPTILSATMCRVDMGRARADDGAGGVERRGGRVWRFQRVAIGNPQCAIALPTPAEVDALDLAAIGPASSTRRCSPTARTCRGTPSSSRAASARGSSSAAWGRRPRRAPARAARRSPTCCAGATRR